VAVEARGGSRGAVAVRFQPALNGALGVDAVKADANRLELAALSRAADRLRVQAEQLGEFARLVVALDHRRLGSLVGLEARLTTIAAHSERAMIAKVMAVLNMRAVE